LLGTIGDAYNITATRLLSETFFWSRSKYVAPEKVFYSQSSEAYASATKKTSESYDNGKGKAATTQRIIDL